MKKILSIVFILFVIVVSCFANATKEKHDVNLAVMQGPTGFSSAMLPDYINVTVYPSPNEAVAKLINGELDMAVLPANTAANLFNKGVNIQVLAVVGEGMLSILGTGKTSDVLSVPGAGGTPDHMATLLFQQYERNYSVAAPAQIAQLLIAGKIDLAILPQPFVSMVLSKNSNVKILNDVQKAWADKTGEKQYPMSVLVVSESFAKSNGKFVESVKKDYRASIEKVLASPHEAALKIEEIGIMSAALAEGAISDCAITFVEGKAAKYELETYYKILMDLAPEAIGSQLPSENFYN